MNRRDPFIAPSSRGSQVQLDRVDRNEWQIRSERIEARRYLHQRHRRVSEILIKSVQGSDDRTNAALAFLKCQPHWLILVLKFGFPARRGPVHSTLKKPRFIHRDVRKGTIGDTFSWEIPGLRWVPIDCAAKETLCPLCTPLSLTYQQKNFEIFLLPQLWLNVAQ
jgi:hypothetical protein